MVVDTSKPGTPQEDVVEGTHANETPDDLAADDCPVAQNGIQRPRIRTTRARREAPARVVRQFRVAQPRLVGSSEIVSYRIREGVVEGVSSSRRLDRTGQRSSGVCPHGNGKHVDPFAGVAKIQVCSTVCGKKTVSERHRIDTQSTGARDVDRFSEVDLEVAVRTTRRRRPEPAVYEDGCGRGHLLCARFVEGGRRESSNSRRPRTFPSRLWSP